MKTKGYERSTEPEEDGWAEEQRSLSGLVTLTKRIVNGEFHRRMDARRLSRHPSRRREGL